METTMKDDAHLKRERQKRKLKVIFAVAMGIVPIATFFLPYVNYTFKDSTFVLSAYQILTSPGIRFQGYLISIPLLSKIAVLCGAVLALTGGALLLLKKPGLAGTGFVLSAATPLIVLMTSSSIQTAVTSLGVSNIIISYQWPFLLTLILGLAAGVLAIWTKGGEKLAESIFRIFACVSVGSVVIITVYMIVSGAPAIAEIGLGNFLFGTEWEPKSGVYGILPLILSSIAGTVGAVIIGVPIGIFNRGFSVGNRSEMGGQCGPPGGAAAGGYSLGGLRLFRDADHRSRDPEHVSRTDHRRQPAGGNSNISDYGAPHHCQCVGNLSAGGAGILPGGFPGPGHHSGENYL